MSLWNSIQSAFFSVGDFIFNPPQKTEEDYAPDARIDFEESFTKRFGAKNVALYLGVATGKMKHRGKPNGLDSCTKIILKDNDCCENICALGGIGSGKTSRVIQPLLWQLARQDVGGLIFDIKGDFCNDAQAICNEAGRRLIRVGVGSNCMKFNLLEGLTPEQATGFLRSVFFLTGGSSGGDSFWIDQATQAIQSCLTILQVLGSEYYSLGKCYEFIIIQDVQEDLMEKADLAVEEKSEYANGSVLQRDYSNAKKYFVYTFNKLPEKTKESLKATITNVLGPFQAAELVDTFSAEKGNYDIVNILEGDIVAVDMPLSKWRTAGIVVYTLIKLRFFDLLQKRQADKGMPQKHVFFMCDEYQEIISAAKSGLSDLSFWDKSRSAKCVGIISTQSVSAFRSAIGNQTITDTILSNFRQKIFFKTEDVSTIDYIQQLTGSVEIRRVSTTTGENENQKYLEFNEKTKSFSASTSVVSRKLVEPDLIRQLGKLSNDMTVALGFFDIDGHSADDFVILLPCFIKGKDDPSAIPWTEYYGMNYDSPDATYEEENYWLNKD